MYFERLIFVSHNLIVSLVFVCAVFRDFIFRFGFSSSSKIFNTFFYVKNFMFLHFCLIILHFFFSSVCVCVCVGDLYMCILIHTLCVCVGVYMCVLFYLLSISILFVLFVLEIKA